MHGTISQEPGARRSKYFFATRARASFGRPGSTGLEGSAGWLGFVFSLVELQKKRATGRSAD